MRAYCCDCKGCISKEHMDKPYATIKVYVRGNEKSYDLCKDCYIKIMDILEVSNDKLDITINESKETIKKRGEYVGVINRYGIDNLKRDYVDRKLTVQQIADNLNVPRSSVYYMLKIHNISKTTKLEVASDTESKEDDSR